MPYKINPFTGQLDYYDTSGGGGGSTVEVIHVANYSALPVPTTVADDAIYIADAAQGTAWLPGTLGGTYYPAGFYVSNGTIWIYAGSAAQATLAEVNTGTDTDKFVTPSTFTNADKWGTKADKASIIGATKTKITYNADGIVTAGTDATTADIADSIDKRYVTDANLITIGNTSGTNTGDQNLQSVVTEGNTTNLDIQFGAGVGTLLNNGSRLREGSVDAGNGGGKGIAQICAVGYELKWEAGRLYVMGDGGTTIREVSHNFSATPTVSDDNTKGFIVGSRWILDNGDIYVCSDTATGAAIWQLQILDISLNSLNDVTVTTPTNGQILQYNFTTSQWENTSVTIGTGDMQKTVYDTDNDGVVDSAETIPVVVRNPSSINTLRRGTIVYLSGSTGYRPNAYKAQANAESTSSGTFGAVVSDILPNSDGLVCAMGTLHNLDTRTIATYPFTVDTLVDGDALWLDPNNAGYVTKVKPQAPNHIVFIGTVARTHPTLGRIVYRITNGFELDELHNVFINGSLANKDILYYDASTSLWKASSIATTLGFTPVSNSTTVNGHALSSNVTVTKGDVGLGSVDNTSDLSKPVSTATQTALNLKMDTNSSISAHNDVTITTPIVNQILQWNGSQWINASGSVVNAGPGVVYFLTNTTAGFGTYEYMSKTPDALSEIEETVVVNANTVLIHEYISDVNIGKTFIDAGIWEFNFFGYINTLDANFVINTYKRTSGGTETLLFSTETELINWTSPDLSSSVTVQQAFACNATDTLVIKIYGKTTQTSNVTLKLVHSGTTHYSHLHTPLTLAHNDIAGLQGGATGEYFHLNSAVNTKLLGWNSTGIPESDISGSGKYIKADGTVALSANWNAGSYRITAGNITSTGDALLNGSTAGLGGGASTSNIVLGVSALASNTTGIRNVAIGYNALTSQTSSGNYNVAIGYQTLSLNSSGQGSIAIGDTALKNNTTGTINTAIGASALGSNTTGVYNTAIGYNSLTLNTTFGYNIGIGAFTLSSSTGGTQNIAIGHQSLTTLTSGTNNTAFGYRSGYLMTTGNNNSALGPSSLYNTTTGAGNLGVGVNALFTNTTGANNSALGNNALFLNSAGDYNTALGVEAGYNLTGSSNTVLGYQAGKFISDGTTANTTPNQSIYIGRGSKSATATGTNEIVVGYNATGNGSNTTTIGLQGTTTQTLLAGSLKINNAYTLPSTDGSVNQTLKTDGAGNVSWSANSSGVDYGLIYAISTQNVLL